MLESIASVLGMGVATKMLTASAPLGLSVAAFILDWQLAAYGQGQAPDWVKFLFGDQGKMYQDAFLKKVFGKDQFTISINAYLSIAIIDIGEKIFPRTKRTFIK